MQKVCSEIVYMDFLLNISDISLLLKMKKCYLYVHSTYNDYYMYDSELNP